MAITFRPDFSSPWGSNAPVTTHTLNRLGRRDCAALVDQVTGGKTLPEQLRVQIIEKTDGVPLFVEELTKAVLESSLLGIEGTTTRWRARSRWWRSRQPSTIR